ncbi:MAG TPA: hypothetical protein VIV40_19905 [Kofleriaceae bacterium]
MRRLALLLAFTACGSGGAARGGGDVITYHAASGPAGDDIYKPSYDKAEVQHALTAERAAEASGEQRVRELEEHGDYDQLRIAGADLAVRRRFIASLEACEASGLTCPPRLDEPAWSFDIEGSVDPKLDTPLRFDPATWQKVSAELHGRACACRTLACVDSMFVAIDRLETRPMPDVQGDETASLSITRARECLYRLRGLRSTPHANND